MPGVETLQSDQPLTLRSLPTAAGSTFALGSDGLVAPTPEGTLNPDGVLVYLGKPPRVPPATPDRAAALDEAQIAANARLAKLKPRSRPAGLVEQTERAQLGGLSLAELGKVRPKLRPDSIQTTAAAVEPQAPATDQAVGASLMPKKRPADLKPPEVRTARAEPAAKPGKSSRGEIPTKEEDEEGDEGETRSSRAPQVPSSASVSKQATLDNAIRLKDLNLIGVYGTPSNRRALIRLPNGRYKKVKVGDPIDGGRIIAIGDSELRYQKGGRNHTLTMPRG